MYYSESHFVALCSFQKTKDDYKLAETSEKEGKRSKKERKRKDMEELKKEVVLVSSQLILQLSVTSGFLRYHLSMTR